MKKNIKRITAFIGIAVIIFAVCVTAFHHHNPAEKDKHHDCEICSFIYTVNSAILAAVTLFWITAVLAVLILILKSAISSNNQKVFASRAPPNFTA